MKDKRRSKGFSMAEMLIVVAIIVILSGVAFILYMNHLRNMAQLERDTIAKEIYVAAQNHLTTAKSQGYLQLDTNKYGPVGTSTADKDVTIISADKKADVHYLVISGTIPEAQREIYELMLPFGSIDETVRAGGSYIIRYQPSTATVLDVFYAEMDSAKRYPHTFSGGEYAALVDDYRDVNGANHKAERKNYGAGKAVIGWYGGENAIPVGERLDVPTIEIINAERLQVKVTDYNSDKDYALLALIVEGEDSKAKKSFLLTGSDSHRVVQTDSTYTVTLDEITKGETDTHFCELNADTGTFSPGENLKIYAVSYSNTKLTNIAKSQEGITNSLFGYNKDANPTVTQISNIRHLENLDYSISHLNPGTATTKKAVQTTDLIWKQSETGGSGLENSKGFVDIITETGGASPVKIYPVGASGTADDCFYPVCDNYSGTANPYYIEYDGNNHSISNVKVSYDRDAGVFGVLNGTDSGESKVKNLLVLRADITSSSNSAGGLIGSLNGGSVEKCAAALGHVNGSTAAGGLIGTASKGTVTASYSSGHTTGGVYLPALETPGEYDVKSTSGTVGGLIGAAGAATISQSYSTCSVSGGTAGGLIGSGSGSIDSSYATGLVSGAAKTTEGAFAGNYAGTATASYYYEIINERQELDDNGKVKEIYYLSPVGSSQTTPAGITALDQDAATYNTFVGAEESWADAYPEDAKLQTYYAGKYNLQTVKQLGASVDDEGDDKDLVASHYGDWPAPELFVINS